MNHVVNPSTVANGAAPLVAADSGAARDRLLIAMIGLLAGGAWYAGYIDLYRADSELGYNLGLAGGITMALLLLYPVRKRVRLLRSFFPLKYWFGAHMALGIIGPLLIMYHSKFILESKNGSIAFLSMMAVFLSGLVGRVIYRRIHFGLFGRKATLQELKQRLGVNEEDIHSKFHNLPTVEKRLQKFEDRVLDQNVGGARHFYRALTCRFRSYWVGYRSRRELRKVIYQLGKKKNWSGLERARRYHLGSEIIDSYLEAVNRVAQFGVFERLFSLWHIAHVPLIFLLVVTAIIHVVAVHMY